MCRCMGVYVDDVREFAPPDSDDETDRPPLGQRLRGMADELELDSVEEVREIRERS